MIHDVNGLARAGFALPGSSQCRAFCVSNDADLLCVTHAASITIHAWVGDEGAVASAACFRVVAEYRLEGGADAAARQVILRPTFVSPTSVCLSLLQVAGDSSPALALDADLVAVSTERVDLADVFFPFGGNSTRSDSAPDDRQDGADGMSSSDVKIAAADALRSDHDAGSRLFYLLFHAWTGTVFRVIRAGLAPAFDASGAMSVRAAALTGSPCAEAAGGALRAATAGSSLLSAVGAAADARINWGALAPVETGGALLFAALPTAGDTSSTAALAFPVDALGRSRAERPKSAPAVCDDVRNLDDDSDDCDADEFIGLGLDAPAAEGAPLIVLESHPLELSSSSIFPYVLSVHVSGLHIHSSRTGALLQSIRISNATSLVAFPSGDGCDAMFVVASSGVIFVRSLPAFEQAAALVSARPQHYEEALALCRGDTGDTTVDVSPTADDDALPEPLASVDLLARKEITLRRDYGYALWSQGDFAAGLSQLSRAGESVARVLRLFPTLSPVRGGEYNRTPRAPLLSPGPPVPELFDALLPPALAPLVPFLAERRESRDALVDTSLLETLLWLRNHWSWRAGVLAARDGASAGAARASATRYARTARALLGGPHEIEPARAAALICDYAAALSLSVESGWADRDYTALWTGLGDEGAALRLLAASADEAVAVARSLGHPRALRSVGELPMRLPFSKRVVALVDYLLKMAGRIDRSAVLSQLALTLEGARGTEGVLLALGAVMAGGLSSADDVFALLDDLAAREAPEGGPSPGLLLQQPDFWRLRGVASIVRGRLPSLDHLWSILIAPAAAADSDTSNDLQSIADAVALGTPSVGWARHYRIALFEHLTFSAAARGEVVGARVADALAAAYTGALGDIATLRSPAARLSQECGLARVYRERLTRLLKSAEPLDTAAILRGLCRIAPLPAFADETVALRERTNDHAGALFVLVRVLNDMDAVADYCQRVNARSPDACVSSILLQTIGVDIEAPGAAAQPAAVKAIAALPSGNRLLRTRALAKASASVPSPGGAAPLPPASDAAVARTVEILAGLRTASPPAALAALPASLSLALIRPLLEASLRSSSDAVSNAAAARAVTSVTRAQRVAELSTKETSSVQIDKLFRCAICRRNIGALQQSTGGGQSLRPAPFRMYPNGVVAHATCAPDAARCPKTGLLFTV